jgi:hypothetical protein
MKLTNCRRLPGRIPLLVVLVAALIGCERRSARIPQCVDNLRRIELAKDEWAKDRGKSTNNIPSWDDLRPYFPDQWSNNIPLCPASGSYSISAVGEPPTCTIGGPDHSLR